MQTRLKLVKHFDGQIIWYTRKLQYSLPPPKLLKVQSVAGL